MGVAGMPETECGGLSAWALALACRESIKPTFARSAQRSDRLFASRSNSGIKTLALKAGLESSLTVSGFESARACLSAAYLAIGLLVGVVFSLELSALLGAGGGVAGWFALPRALKCEAALRRERLGPQLAEMCEVVALGLRSGLSFDHAFSLYCEYFESGFARDCAQARRQWTLGLVPRDRALRGLSDSYDSPMLSRIVEGMVRSLRFGTSLAETLESAAAEARSVHKAEVEERVAKAPVKMLIPVGALILPAMLIFVLGPIMIDLMEGI